MRLRELFEDGRIVKGVNTTADVSTDEIKTQAAKFGNTVDKDGRPPTLSKKVKGSSTNVLYNLGLSESAIITTESISKDELKKQLAMGVEVEMEHTDDPKLALKIAMDHIKEDPFYYDHLKFVELGENFADGKVKGKSRPGRVKKSGASCNGSVTSLRKKAKNSSGERAKMYHWCANMKSGKK